MKKHLAFTIIVLFLLIPKCQEATEPVETIVPDNEEEITIASWNLKNFGQTKLNDSARIDVIVSVLKKFDIIALQEVQDVSLALPTELIAKINASGENYKVVSSERLGRGSRKEQYLFVYDDDVIDFISDTTGYGIEPNDEFAREPFYAMFKAGNFDFYLMTIHTDPDDVDVEIPAMKVAYEDLQDKTTDEDDIILLGDLNAKAPGVTAGSYITMDSIALISNSVFTIKEETNTRGGKSYDNIIFQDNFTAEYSDSAGVYAFWEDYNLTEDDGFKISDHKLVWAKFRIDLADDDLAKSIIQDVIIFKNGDFINGKVLTEVFNIKTPYGQITVKQKDVEHIHIGGTHFTRDEIVTLEMNKFTGVLQEETIDVKLQSGQELKIEKNLILTLIILTNRPF